MAVGSCSWHGSAKPLLIINMGSSDKKRSVSTFLSPLALSRSLILVLSLSVAFSLGRSLLLLFSLFLPFGVFHLHFYSKALSFFPFFPPYLSVFHSLSLSPCRPVKHGNFAWQCLRLSSEHTRRPRPLLYSGWPFWLAGPNPPPLSSQFLSFQCAVQLLQVNCNTKLNIKIHHLLMQVRTSCHPCH